MKNLFSNKPYFLSEPYLWTSDSPGEICRLGSSFRLRKASETLAKAKPLFRSLGIKALRIDGNDQIGVPVYWAWHPKKMERYPQLEWNFGGKGLRPIEARVSMMMESLERSSVNRIYHPELVRAPYRRIARKAVHPAEFGVSSEIFDETREQEWGWGWCLHSGRPKLIHANFLFTPYQAVVGQTLLHTEFNGLASGNTMEEAILHALYELIERDAFLLQQKFGPPLRRIPQDSVRQPFLRRILDAFSRRGCEVLLLDLTFDMPIPTFGAIVFDEGMPGKPASSLICGTHSDPSIAMARCLAEVCQERAGMIFIDGYFKKKTSPALNRRSLRSFLKRYRLRIERNVDFSSYRGNLAPSLGEELSRLLKILQKQNIRIYAANMGGWQDRIAIVKLNASGLQPMTANVPFYNNEENGYRFSIRSTSRLNSLPSRASHP